MVFLKCLEMENSLRLILLCYRIRKPMFSKSRSKTAVDVVVLITWATLLPILNRGGKHIFISISNQQTSSDPKSNGTYQLLRANETTRGTGGSWKHNPIQNSEVGSTCLCGDVFDVQRGNVRDDSIDTIDSVEITTHQRAVVLCDGGTRSLFSLFFLSNLCFNNRICLSNLFYLFFAF